MKELLVNFSLVVQSSVGQNVRIFRLEQLGAKKSLENLVVVIGVAVWNVADLVLIAVMARLGTAGLICSVGAGQALLRKDKLLLFKIEPESIISVPLRDEAIILGGLRPG